MPRRSLLFAAGLALALGGCSADDHPLTAPAEEGRTPPPEQPAAAVSQARNERLAEWLALALRDPAFRRTLKLSLDRSPYREHKLHLQGLLAADGGAERARVAALAGADESLLARDLAGASALELYFPVPGHRERWSGDEQLLVATALRDGDAPVAFDLRGGRQRLDPDVPPTTPVLMVQPAELDFGSPASRITCLYDCGTDPGGGSGTGSSGPSGLYLTRTAFTGTFESWFKGSPEFEVHMLGQEGTSQRMISYQCAGEHAGGAYAFDQNSTTWVGNVLLFSDAQLAAYKQQHPNVNLRIMVLEDDDGACQIRTDSTRVTNLFKAVDAAYSSYTAGTDTQLTSLQRAWKRASGLIKVISAATSWILTPDDPVGNAVEDPTAAGGFFVGGNWIVRGENNVANGALRLEMR